MKKNMTKNVFILNFFLSCIKKSLEYINKLIDIEKGMTKKLEKQIIMASQAFQAFLSFLFVFCAWFFHKPFLSPQPYGCGFEPSYKIGEPGT